MPYIFTWFTLKKSYPKAVRISAFAWMVFVVLILAFNKGEVIKSSANTNNKTQINQKTEANKLTLSRRQLNILQSLLEEDLKIFAQNGRSMSAELESNKKYKIVSAIQLQQEYDKNEVAADLKYKDKKVIVHGTVKSIDRSIGENYFLILKGENNMFSSPMLQMADDQVNYLADLNKGDSVTLTCTAGGMLMGSAMANDCLDMNTWATNEAKEVTSSIDEKLNAKENSAIILAIMAIAIDAELGSISKCDNNIGGECLNDTENKLKNKDLKVKMAEIAKKSGINPNIFADTLKQK